LGEKQKTPAEIAQHSIQVDGCTWGLSVCGFNVKGGFNGEKMKKRENNMQCGRHWADSLSIMGTTATDALQHVEEEGVGNE